MRAGKEDTNFNTDKQQTQKIGREHKERDRLTKTRNCHDR